MPKAIKDLRFGSIDAQDYTHSDPDDIYTNLFRRSFLEGEHLQKLLDPKTIFYMGEKGTGKTAYAAYACLFLRDTYNAETIFFSAEDFERFSEISRSLALERTQYTTLWTFVLLTIFLAKASKNIEFAPDGRIAAFFQATRDVSLADRVDRVSQAIEIAGQAGILYDYFLQHSQEKTNRGNVERALPSFKLSRIVDLCIAELKSLPEASQFSLFIDSIDVRPEALDYPSYLEIVSSLCNAVYLVNVTQLWRSPGQFKIVVLLRPDIFESLRFQNKGTKLDTYSHVIDWTTHYVTYRSSEIFKLADRLLQVQQGPSATEPEGATFDSYFGFKIESKRRTEPDDPFVLFLKHSFYKPRDIIKYLSLMATAYSRDERGDGSSFDSDVFRDKGIRKSFSDYLLQEIEDQTSFYYSDAEWDQFKAFNDGFLSGSVSRRDGDFSYENFVSAHDRFVRYNEKNDLHTPPSFRTADILLQFMFDLNIIGYKVVRTMRDGNERTFTNYSFRQRSMANLRPKVPTGGNYVMHYGLAKALFTDFVG